MSRSEHFHKIVEMQEELSKEAVNYWEAYSHFGTWQFWVVSTLLVAPLIVIYFRIDRGRIFHIGFFGFAVHVLFSYIDSFGIRSGLWGYPYQIVPVLPSLSLDAAIIPVTIMLVYQWTIRHNKNFYLYAFITAVFFSFGFKPILVIYGFFEKYKWVNYPVIFVIYFGLFLLAYLLTKIFMKMSRKGGTNEN